MWLYKLHYMICDHTMQFVVFLTTTAEYVYQYGVAYNTTFHYSICCWSTAIKYQLCKVKYMIYFYSGENNEES